MADTPGVLGRRYLPFLAVIGVQVLLAAVAPSRGLLAGNQFAGGSGSGSSVSAGAGGSGSAGGGAGPNGVQGGGANAGLSGPAGAGGSGGGGSGGGGSGGASGPGAGGGASGGVSGASNLPGSAAGVDRSDCDKNGNQAGPPNYVFMPPCVPVWHGGDNGPPQMAGITNTAINFVAYKPQANAEVNAILATQGLAASTAQSCAADEAFLKVINKYWSLYGRHFVPLDGPGANSGASQQGCSGFPYFQSTCPLTPPNPACDAAEAKVLAAMHPAMVIGAPNVFFIQAFVPFQIPIIAFGELPESYYEADQPYLYGLLMDGQAQANFDAEYWCKKLNDQPASHAGPDVQTTRGWGATPGAVPVRKLAIVYPVNNGDESNKISVDQMKAALTGGKCKTPGGVLLINYASDITTAQQQTNTVVQELIANKITTVACWCDAIAPVFLTSGMQQQNYYPEHFVVGVGLMDYDVLGRLYNPAEWSHAFGVSDLAEPAPFAQSDAANWWHAAGNSGLPDTTENATVPFFSLMASAFQVAGPSPTPAVIADKLEKGPVYGGWAKYHDPTLTAVSFRQPSPWTAAKDVREVYWSQTRNSKVDGNAGSYCPVNGGQRYFPGEFTFGNTELFNSGKNGC